MSCRLCHKEERGTDKNRDYLCGRCVLSMIKMDRDQKRTFIDGLYVKGQYQEAEFLEKIFEGTTSKPVEQKEKPKLLIRRP